MFATLLIVLFSSQLSAQEGLGDVLLYIRQAEALANARLFPEAIHFQKEAIRLMEREVPSPKEEIVDSYLSISRYFRRDGALDSAYFYLGKARLMAEQSLPPDAPVVSDVYNALGIYYYYQGKCEQAMAFYEMALERRLRHFGRWNGRVADAYNNMAICYDMMGEHEEAIKRYEEALEIRLTLYDECSPPIAECYMNIGVGYHYLLDFDQALAYYDKALEIWEETLDPDHPDFALIFNNMGVCYQNKGDYRRAQDILERNLRYTIRVHGEDHFEVANAYNNLGLNFFDQGDFSKALVYFEKALAIRLQHFEPRHHLIASLYNNIGNCHRNRKDYVKAFYFIRRGLEIRQEVFGDYHREVADSYNDLGLCYEAIGDYAQALVQYRYALEIDGELGEQGASFVADSYLRMGRCFFREGDLEAARSYYQKSLKIKQATLGSLHPEVADVLTELGRCYPDQPERGLVFVDRALKALHLDRAGRVNQMQVTAPLQALRTLNVEGELQMALYRQSDAEPWLQEAHATFLMARRVIERTRRSYQEPGSKQLLLDQFFRIFENSIEVAHALHKLRGDRQYLEEALAIAEGSKNVLLNEAVQKAQAEEFAGIPSGFVQRENDLLLDINFYEEQVLLEEQKGGKGDPGLLDFFREKVFERKSAYYSLLDTIASSYPEYYELRYGKNDFSLVQLQARLSPGGETLIEFFSGDSTLFLFVINPDTIAVYAEPRMAEVNRQVRRLRQQLFAFDPLAGDPSRAREAFVQAALPLYRMLIEPAAPLIRSQGLIIVPDGLLGYLPFESLLTNDPGPEGSWKDLPYLIHRYRISYQYAAGLLISGHPEPDLPPGARVLALAPSFEPGAGLKPLRYNQEEARTIRRQIPGRYLLGAEATEKAFRQWAEGYRVIHLATHAQANDTIGAQSFLAFSPPQDTSGQSFLFLRDLYGLHLNADMVVLSACETGAGELLRGEGIVSLGRGFLYAGARSIVTTLWSVDDQPSAWIMGRFYEALKEGYPKDEALRLAKLDYLEANSALRGHPLFWAGYIPIGEMEPVSFREKPSYWAIRVLAGLGALVLAFSVFNWFRRPGIRRQKPISGTNP